MIKGNLTLDTDGIFKEISKNKRCISVFIQPNGIINPKEDIENLNLICNENDLYSEKLMIEFYSDDGEAGERVDQFKEHKDHYYVSMWDVGDFICSNLEED
ncbi:UNVERIFIED_ORG: hypothetical protein B2H93_04760 [Clostridium botulinum]